jgi:lactoylglutathione lyase
MVVPFPPLAGEGYIPPSHPAFRDSMQYRFVYVGIQVRDLDRSIAFYRDLLGMVMGRREKVAETRGEWAELRTPGSDLLLELNWYPEGSRFYKEPYRHGEELDHLAFDCEDADVAYRELVAKGAKPGLPPFDEGGSRLAFVVDPDGVWIELASKAH